MLKARSRTEEKVEKVWEIGESLGKKVQKLLTALWSNAVVRVCVFILCGFVLIGGFVFGIVLKNKKNQD